MTVPTDPPVGFSYDPGTGFGFTGMLTDAQWQAQLAHQEAVRRAELDAEVSIAREKALAEKAIARGRQALMKTIIVAILVTLGIIACLAAGALVIENDQKRDGEMIQLCAEQGKGWQSLRGGEIECVNR